MKLLVYVAGPYGDQGGFLAIDKNITVARAECKWLIENGFMFLCPHMNSAHFEVITPTVTVDEWYAQDIRLLRMCDAMVLVGNWQESKGVKAEIEVARNYLIPVFDLGGRKDFPLRVKYGGEDGRTSLLGFRDKMAGSCPGVREE